MSVDDGPGTIQSIDRAAGVLGLLDQNTRTLTPALVAERLGLNRTTAHRYLNSLARAGFLTVSFGPGPLLDQLSSLMSVRQRILTYAPPIMRGLSDETGLTTTLSVLGLSGAVVTLVEEAFKDTIVLTVRVGTVLEVKAAQSRVLLAFQSDPATLARAHASLTPDRAAAERTVLAGVRRDRLAWADLHREGLSSAAVPIFAAHDVQAAMGMLGTTAMLLGSDRAAERVRLLRAAGQSISALLPTPT